MIGDLARWATAEISHERGIHTRALINLNEEPLEPFDNPTMNPDVQFTRFEYCLRYKPSYLAQKRSKPFMLRIDMNTHGETVRFETVEEMWEISKSNKKLRFVLNNCLPQITPETLEILRMNEELPYHLNFDVSGYVKKLCDKIEARTGERPSGRNMFWNEFTEMFMTKKEEKLETDKEVHRINCANRRVNRERAERAIKEGQNG